MNLKTVVLLWVLFLLLLHLYLFHFFVLLYEIFDWFCHLGRFRSVLLRNQIDCFLNLWLNLFHCIRLYFFFPECVWTVFVMIVVSIAMMIFWVYFVLLWFSYFQHIERINFPPFATFSEKLYLPICILHLFLSYCMRIHCSSFLLHFCLLFCGKKNEK